MYDKFNDKLPKYWVVKITKDNEEEFKNTVGKYITNVYKMPWIYCNINSYYGYEGTLAYKATNFYRNYENFKTNPTILTLEEFKSYFEEFELPEKWCIKITKENLDIVGDYYNREGNSSYTDKSNIGQYYSSHNLTSGISVMDSDFGANFIMSTADYGKEITFEQFKKYVLKEEIVMKKIIGYKLKKEQYLASARSIMGCNPKHNDWPIEIVKPGSTDCDKLKEAGVLDLWFEPVYEEDFKVGDWVVVLDKGTSDLRVGDIGKITCLGADKPHPDFRVEARGITAVNWLEPKDVRLATSEEIAKAQSKELYFGKVKFTIKPGQDYAETEYGKVPKKDIKEAIDWVKNAPSLAGFEFSLHNPTKGSYAIINACSNQQHHDFAIGFGCKYGKLSELEAIYKAFD